MISLKGMVLAIGALGAVSAPVEAHDPRDAQSGVDREIEMCVAAVGKRANYDGAKRVLHLVMEINQKNIAEQEIRIDTLVYASDSEFTSRQYASVCVTRGPLKVVTFRIEETAGPDYSATL